MTPTAEPASAPATAPTIAEGVAPLLRALLYEGYVLYPYRASSLKNRQRFNFGALYPAEWCAHEPSDACNMHVSVLASGADAMLAVTLRFLHLVLPREGWHEAEEQSAALPIVQVKSLAREPEIHDLSFEPAHGSGARVSARITLAAEALDPPAFAGSAYRMNVLVENTTELGGADTRDLALVRALVSTHLLFEIEDGALVSLLEPPAALCEEAARCENRGAWPVLVGPKGEGRAMLASPIILYDHPAVAKESPGDLFDGGEIDEILTLRILTLTDEEKAAARATDPRARALLDRTEALGPRELMRLHGGARAPFEIGDRVRLAPKGRADAIDVILAGRAATVRSIEQDAEGRLFASVTIDDDPGADLGISGQPGHRFFFRTDEMERIHEA